MRVLVVLAALVAAGCACNPKPKTVKLDKHGCYFDGCNTCCRMGEVDNSFGCTALACIEAVK
jgi:hypothetical protein